MKLTVLLILIINLSLSAQQTAIEYSRYSDKVAVNTVSSILPDSIFNYVISKLGILDFSDCNNCDSRAHITAKVIEKQFPGVRVCKAWIFTDHKRASRTGQYTYKKNDYLNDPGECGKWGYHVAPMLVIQHQGSSDSIIIDPSVQNSPLNLSGWSAILMPDKENCYIIVKDIKYYTFPDDANGKFEDTKEIWTDSQNESLVDEDCSRSIESIFSSRNLIWDSWTFRYYVTVIRNLLD